MSRGIEPTVEHLRVRSGRPDGPLHELGPWALWGPYLAERAWGTVREDYSATGEAWTYFPHDHARSRAYRWNEDGMAGICDLEQRLCLALALWNGRDPILKERMFGLAGPEGNHGEDVKEYWWYTDALPSHAWLKWRYHYPQHAFPYDDLVEENARRAGNDPEYELVDTGVFDGGYWVVEVTYAKSDPEDVSMLVSVRNAGPSRDSLHVLPTLWFRNTWSWSPGASRPEMTLARGAIHAEHPTLGAYVLHADPDDSPIPLFCENETNSARLFGQPTAPPYPKDGIGDHVVSGSATVNRDSRGTKAAWWYVLDVDPGETVELRLRLRPEDAPERKWHGVAFDELLEEREAEADAFYATLTPADASDEEASVMRQGFAGMIWSKQFYAYDIERWLEGDPGHPAPPSNRRDGRNAQWGHLDLFDIFSMPDPWEYPWFAAWDLAFHAVVFADIDPVFAKYQLLALTREWSMHPNGALPAYEWAFDDVNPPVHAGAALAVYLIDGRRDRVFLAQIFQKLLLNFTWWVNRVDAEGRNLFQGGFLGLDNVGPFDRSHMPVNGVLEQSDGTAWMAGYCLAMFRMALELAREDKAYEGLVTKFVEHYVRIVRALDELWDDDDALYYDRLKGPDGREHVLRFRSIVGLIPMLMADSLDKTTIELISTRFSAYRSRLRGERIGLLDIATARTGPDGDEILLSLVSPERLRRLLADVLSEDSFLSPYGLRSLSKRHERQPFTIAIDGVEAAVDYEPAESTSGMFGGNSNWRGPVWFPVNLLVIDALERYHLFLGDEYTVECPTGSGQFLTLHEVADQLRRRLISIFLPGLDGRRPVNGGTSRFDHHPDWRELVAFHEYFHGDDGRGLGASHQTGWTGLVAHMIAERRDLGRQGHHPLEIVEA